VPETIGEGVRMLRRGGILFELGHLVKTKSAEIDPLAVCRNEIEILGKYMPEGNKHLYSVLLVNMHYRTRPSMSYQQEGYQRGPLHVGETKITFRGYTWNREQIEKYKLMRAQEDFELMGMVDGSVKAAMDALGEELEKYLAEAGDTLWAHEKDSSKKPPPRRPTVMGPFGSIFKGFGELFGAGGPPRPKSAKKAKIDLSGEKARARSYAKKSTFVTYKNFKKAHKMLHW